MAFDGELNFVTLDDGTKRCIKDLFDRTSADEIIIDSKTTAKYDIDIPIKIHNKLTTVKDIIRVEEERMVMKVELENRYEIFVTPDHPVTIFSGGTWLRLPLCDVSIGEDMLVDDVKCQVVSMGHYRMVKDTYGIVCPLGIFSVNNILVCN